MVGHVECKFEGRQETALVEKTKMTRSEAAQGEQSMIEGFNIAPACAMVAQTAWHCSPLLCQLHSDGRYSCFL